MSRTYTITLNEAQAGTIQIACEVLARLGIGQFRDALEQLPTTEFMPDGWHEDMAAVENILRRHMQPNGQTPYQISTRQEWPGAARMMAPNAGGKRSDD